MRSPGRRRRRCRLMPSVRATPSRPSGVRRRLRRRSVGWTASHASRSSRTLATTSAWQGSPGFRKCQGGEAGCTTEVRPVAGKIRDEDIALVRERTSIADVISEHVTLRSAGGGNLKGLCPFHDEKTPSFTVSPARNVYFCHGCGAGGDAIKFLMDADHLSFLESVERLAGRAGVQLRYRETGNSPVPRQPAGQKKRLVEAHAAAVEFYTGLLTSPGARPAREFLAQRGFGRDAAERFGCGFAPEAWD